MIAFNGEVLLMPSRLMVALYTRFVAWPMANVDAGGKIARADAEMARRNVALPVGAQIEGDGPGGVATAAEAVGIGRVFVVRDLFKEPILVEIAAADGVADVVREYS